MFLNPTVVHVLGGYRLWRHEVAPVGLVLARVHVPVAVQNMFRYVDSMKSG